MQNIQIGNAVANKKGQLNILWCSPKHSQFVITTKRDRATKLPFYIVITLNILAIWVYLNYNFCKVNLVYIAQLFAYSLFFNT